MDFDHRDPSQKGWEISKISKWASVEKLFYEIEKCD
jgi:hypothetical protein